VIICWQGPSGSNWIIRIGGRDNQTCSNHLISHREKTERKGLMSENKETDTLIERMEGCLIFDDTGISGE
jgi:hypothetical protein